MKIIALTARAYTIPTGRPEADGTIDHAIKTDQRHCFHVADNAVLFDGPVGHGLIFLLLKPI